MVSGAACGQGKVVEKKEPGTGCWGGARGQQGWGVDSIRARLGWGLGLARVNSDLELRLF